MEDTLMKRSRRSSVLGAADAGCDGYITKPIDTRALSSVVKTYLRR